MSAITVEPSRDSALELTSRAVVMVDGGSAFSDRVCRITERRSDLHVAEVARSPEEAVWISEHLAIDVVVIDQPASSRDGLWLCSELKRAANPAPVMICATFPDGVLAAGCVVAGVDALMSQLESDAELCDAICRVVGGERLLPAIPPRVAAMLHDRFDRIDHAIFGMLLAGLSPADVARGLRIPRRELESQRSLLLGKLDILPPTSASRY